jgi:hypothetical protein
MRPSKITRFLVYLLTIFFLLMMIANLSLAKNNPPRRLSYWVWAGISLPADSKESNLYIYQGVFRSTGHDIEFQKKGLYPHFLKANEIHLVFRLEALDDSQNLKNTILTIISHWERNKTQVRGIQIDFDAPTGKLDRYYRFLKALRSWLPSQYALTITGLGDWLLLDQPKFLHDLSSCTDGIVFQLYSGRRYVSNIDRYVYKLQMLDIPFKIGLLVDTQKNPSIEKKFDQNRNYGGSIYFIQQI